LNIANTASVYVMEIQNMLAN